MRKTYISAISFSTATSFQVFSPLVFEISDQFVEDVENNTLDAINIFSYVENSGEESGSKCKQDALKARIWAERRTKKKENFNLR